MTIHYFGTSLDSAGHDFWKCIDNRLEKSGLSYSYFVADNFCPETIGYSKNKKNNLGEVFYFREKQWTICYIEGSCRDTRGGSKSVFFTDEKVYFGDFVLKLVSIQIINKMIKQMPFSINWKLNQEMLEKINELLK